jgi:iron complex outermembrane receptor protein
VRPASRWRIEGTVFHRRERDGIDYVRSTPNDFWQASNIQRLRFTGIESAVVFSPGAHVFDFRYSGLRGAANALPGLLSKYVFNYPVHSGIFAWQARVTPWLAARTRVGALERKARRPYAVWDASLAATRGRLRPYLQFTNISHTRYEEILGVVMPGRAFLAGVDWRFR